LRRYHAPVCPQAEQVIGELPRAGVVVALGDAEPHRGFDQVAAAELRLRLVLELRGGGGEERRAYAAGDGDHAGGVGCDVFDGGEFEVDGDGGSSGLVPLVGIGVAGVFGVRARGEGANANDVALHGAAEAVGVGEQGGLR
jgi:hypothetical protein